MEEEEITIGKRIRYYRILHNHSQENLGKLLNLPKQAISRIERGQRKVSHVELLKIADYLEEPIEVFSGEDIKFKLINKNMWGVPLPKFMLDFLEDYNRFTAGQFYPFSTVEYTTKELINILNIPLKIK